MFHATTDDNKRFNSRYHLSKMTTPDLKGRAKGHAGVQLGAEWQWSHLASRPAPKLATCALWLGHVVL